MAQRTHEIRGSAGGNFETVKFDAVHAPNQYVPPTAVESLPDSLPVSRQKYHTTPDKGSKYIGVHHKYAKTIRKGTAYFHWRWKVGISARGKRMSTSRATEIEAALQYDNWIKEYRLNRTTNYDLYGEYWK